MIRHGIDVFCALSIHSLPTEARPACQLVSSLHLQGTPSEWEIGDHGSYIDDGICSLGAPHIKESLPDAVQASLTTLAIRYLRIAPGSLFPTATTTDGSSSSLPVQLADLDLSDCIVTDGDKGLETGLAALGPSLRRLRIQRLFEHRGFMQLYSVPFPNASLPSLTALTRLELAGSVRSAAHLSTLLELRELYIQKDGGFDLTAQDLPESTKLTSLTFFNAVGYPGPQNGAASMAPAAVLARVPALRHLELSSFMAADPPLSGTAALLAQLSRLTQLTCLAVREGPLAQPLKAGAAAAAYSSLTAGSNLQTLVIEDAHLPNGVWQHVFGAGRQLHDLKSLVLKKDRWHSHTWYAVSEQVYKAGAMTADDVARLASSCPNVTSLVLKGVQQPGVPLQPIMQQLTGLRSLKVNDASDADAGLLRQLPELQDLVLSDSSLSNDAIQQLTQLTQLEQLQLVQVKRQQAEEAGNAVPTSGPDTRRFTSKVRLLEERQICTLIHT